MKFLWYEDMKKNLVPIIKNLTSFLGYEMTDAKIKDLDEFLEIGNYRYKDQFLPPEPGWKWALTSKSSCYRKYRVASEPNPQAGETMKKFFRKGEVGDWKNYFTGTKLDDWNTWIKRELEGTDIQIQF